MKRTLLYCLLSAAVTYSAYGQKSIDNSVQLTATISKSPVQVTLSWQLHNNATNYYVYKKTKGATGWTPLTTTPLAATDTQYVDNTVSLDSAYEYRVYKHSSGTDPKGHGYIYVGMDALPIHKRGELLILVDSTYADSCQAELATLMDDISKDGWKVSRKDFGRTVDDVTIKNYIKTVYQSSDILKAVYIVGHLAVPYSGELAPDGHTNNHRGAWPADVFYADMDGIWTDNSVNNTSASRAATKNIPGDGKWDQSGIPGELELQISRIDVYDMPLFGKTEIQLMKSYLNRAHDYKVGNIAVTKRGLVDDNFQSYDEAFAANAYRNFSVLLGDNNIEDKDLVSTLNTDFYQWAYGCGAGSYNRAGGIGYTDSFVNNDVNAIFTMMFGSYFGDWDNQNNFLRAPLCSDVPALTSCWAGRPNWFFHHMALGEHIGYSAWLSQNNSSVYTPTGYAATGVHTVLLGDLTLRTDYIKPPTNLQLTSGTNMGAVLNWTASTDPNVVGYYVYSSDDKYGEYELKSVLVNNGTTFTDYAGTDGNKWYMVRAVKLEQTPSGTYYNLSLGAKDSATIDYPTSVHNIAKRTLAIYPNPAQDQVVINTAATAGIISIVSMEGKIVWQQELSTLQHKGNGYIVNISTIPNGQYILQLNNKGNIHTQKFIKTH